MARSRVDKRPQAIRDLADIAGFDSHLIFYRPFESGVEIIRVIHAKRDIEGLFGGQS